MNNKTLCFFFIIIFHSFDKSHPPFPFSFLTSSKIFFAPPDAAFSQSGQPALSLLQYHFCPLPLSLATLRSLPSGTRLPTLFPGHMLVVTSSPSDPGLSLNNVTVTTGSSPIFDDGSLIVFGIKDFLDPNFQAPLDRSIQNPGCGSSEVGFPGASWLGDASKSLRSSGYLAMASFLDSQLLGFDKERVSAMTVFSPPDEALSNLPPEDSADVFLRHVVPCKLLYSDMANFSDGTVLPTYLDGFMIAVTRLDNVLMLNGVPAFQTDLYRSDSLAVHGLSDVLVAQETSLEVADPEPENQRDGRKIEDVMSTENTEF